LKRAITFLFLTASAGLCAVEETPIDPSDDFSPMMLAITLILLAVVLIIFAIGIVLAIIIAVCCLILVSLGIVSTAALTGILRQKFSSGLRALHYQLCAAVALPAGIVAFWLGVWLFSSDIPLPAILIIGSAAGICAGLVVAFVLDHAVGLAYRHFKRPPTESTTAIEP
jgi:hypothetical protein|tara:strand:- start:6783 stop:7289 length:507 start_codon:yes stop_codon:yes gene_type:complete